MKAIGNSWIFLWLGDIARYRLVALLCFNYTTPKCACLIVCFRILVLVYTASWLISVKEIISPMTCNLMSLTTLSFTQQLIVVTVGHQFMSHDGCCRLGGPGKTCAILYHCLLQTRGPGSCAPLFLHPCTLLVSAFLSSLLPSWFHAGLTVLLTVPICINNY